MQPAMRIGEAGLTADRDELRYLVPGAAAADLAGSLALRLPAYRHPSARVADPGASHACTTTVYFDGAQRQLYRAAINDPVHVKVRVREYYQTAIDAPDVALEPCAREPRMVWIELKMRDGQRSTKRRVCVPKAEVERWLPRAGSPEHAPPNGCVDAELTEVAAELARIRARLGGTLVPSCVVSYRRLSFQDDRAALRITLDREVCAFAPRADLWSEHEVLSRQALGAPVHEVASCVLEIKSRVERPAWAAELLARFGAVPLPYGKFALASRAIHGPL